MSAHEDAIFLAVRKLFALYERGNDIERAGAYARALVRLPIDRFERAIEWAETTWEQKSPPPVPWLLRVAWKPEPPKAATNPVTRAEEEAEQAQLKVLRYYLEHFSMADWYDFKRAFGYAPSASTYAKFGIAVPEGVTFVAPAVAWCQEQRSKARRDCHAAFHELGSKFGAKLPPPEVMAKAVADRDARDAHQRAANEELPF